jgi:hypothetical protein
MNAFRTKKTDEDGRPEPARTRPARSPDLTLGMVHQFLHQIADALAADAAPWRKEVQIRPRGADFDLRDGPVLDNLTMTGDALGEALARGDAAAEVGASILPHLDAAANALERHKPAPNDARQQELLKRHQTVLHELAGGMSGVARQIAELSSAAARSAATLDPDGTRRILDRMHNIGDATMRLIEDKIASSSTRDEGKRMRALRDDLKSWIDERTARVDQIKIAVDELNIRSNALLNVSLMHAKRLAAAVALTGKAFGRSASGSPTAALVQISPEAMVLSAGLRALLLEGRSDITSPLRT